MNKKILELAKESGFYVYNGLIFAETTSETMSAKMEKFADLIVKECLSNMNNCDGDLDFAVWLTKIDFGIE